MAEYPKVEIREGLARVIVPDLSKYSVSGRPEPAHAPVFYNPRMEVNRSLATVITSAYAKWSGRKGLVICEPLAGTGVRAVRYALEVPEVYRVIANDISDEAYRLIKENVELNGLRDTIEVYKEDANQLMLKIARCGGCDVVDIDPFGSPQPFIECALRAVRNGGLLCVTATDVGVLVGKYPLKCVRRYGAIPRRDFPFKFEVGLRILMYLIAKYAIAFDYGVHPLISYLDGHYYRACFVVYKERPYAMETLDYIGYAYYSPKTLARGFVGGFPLPEAKRRYASYAGPLWIGYLWDVEFVLKYLLDEASSRDYISERARELAVLIGEEVQGPNTPYTLTTELGRIIGRDLPVREIIELMRGLGYTTVRSHFDPRAFRTDADLNKVLPILQGLYR